MWKSLVCGMLGAALPLASLAVPALAQEVEEERIIQVAPDKDAQESPQWAESAPQPAYWIGLMGGPVSEELRAHLELPTGRGILVREVVPESPAEKAGLQQHDILLSAGGDELNNMQDLVKHVVDAGETEGQIELELIRHGRQETAQVAPEKRPERAVAMMVNPRRHFDNALGGEGGQPSRFLFRNLGPDVLLGQPFRNEMPNGVSVTMKKEGDKPAEITVKRGDEEWTVVEGDAKSIEQLPEDLRPFVANMTRGPMVFHHEFDRKMFQPFDGDLQERLEAMERQMRELEERLLDRGGDVK